MQPTHHRYSEVDILKSNHANLNIIDNIDLAIGELFDIKFPSKKDTKTELEVKEFEANLAGQDKKSWGIWVYYPWLNSIVHFPPKVEYRALRTARNKNLITDSEQEKLYEATILVAGMSVGSNVVEALVSQGISGKLILVDMDIIEPTNLNRIRSPYYHVGLHKVEAIARKVWEIDPFIEVYKYLEGLNESNLQDIIDKYSVDIIVDEVDSLRVKVAIREKAKSKSIPVIMAADDGDNALIDIERYDLDSELELFSGAIPEDVLSHIKNDVIPRSELGVIIGRHFVGSDHIPLRMYESLMEVGKSLPSWPQLGGAAALSGVVLAYVSKKIILGQPVKSGRTLVSVDEKISLEKLEPYQEEKLDQFKTMLSGDL